jgi:hypothetical protein
MEPAVRLASARGMPADSARAIAPIRGRLATTWTISARIRRARIRSIRFWSVVPPPETQTASRMGESMMGGLRGAEGMRRFSGDGVSPHHYEPAVSKFKFRPDRIGVGLSRQPRQLRGLAQYASAEITSP